MPRPHIEFLHAQQLEWVPAPFVGEAWRGVEAKLLSRDAASGACSVLLRYPRSWRAPPLALESAHELFVLDGALECGEVRYGLDDYAWLPPGHARAAQSSPEGAVVLSFFDREPRVRSQSPELQAPARATQSGDAPAPAAPACAAAAIERIDTHNMPWTRHDIDPSVQFLNLSHKVLRHVPETGEKTILLSSGAQTHPREWREARLAHDCVEEMYLLGGDIIGERGTMYEGAYFWRPPQVWHGPFGSRRGSLSLIRFLEGHHRNRWSEDVREFSLLPQHAPALPAELAAQAGRAWQPARF